MAAASEQERLIADHEATHGPLPRRIRAELRAGTQLAGAVGAKTGGELVEATEGLRLEVVETKLTGERALVGHALGLRLLIPAEGFHGPRETAALLYLFRDAIAVRPTDDAPMSAVPLYGLHIVLPQVAVARWIYKAGRTAHANIDLAKDERGVDASLQEWTVDDFRLADDKVQVFMLNELSGRVRLYQHLGLVRLDLEVQSGRKVRLKSALPETSDAHQRLWDVFVKVLGDASMTIDRPADENTDPSKTS
jgi:hypothetical protein